MVERYHELDESVLREILGKKVTSKTRKDLDDVSELTNVPLRSCHRQYDNIQRYALTEGPARCVRSCYRDFDGVQRYIHSARCEAATVVWYDIISIQMRLRPS